MAVKKVEIDERVIAIQAEMDKKVYEIHQMEQEQAELQALLDARVQQLKDSFEGKFNTLNTRKEYLITELKGLFEQVPQKATKTQRKVSLLSGDVVIKNATTKIDCDKKELLEWAKESGQAEYINTKTVEEFNWSDFKAILEIREDGAIVNTETGEVVKIDGLSVMPVAEQVVIK